MDTAVWRADLASSTAGPFFSDTDHAYDNGSNGGFRSADGLGPRVTGNGVAWLRSGPYGDPDAYEPVAKAVGGSAAVFSPITQPVDFDTWYTPGQSATAYTFMGLHAGSLKAIDYDVFFYDPATHQTMPVCDIGWAPGTDPETPNYYTKQQADPAIGPGLLRLPRGLDRLSRLDAGRRRQPGRRSPVRSLRADGDHQVERDHAEPGKSATISAPVAPNFASYNVRLQFVRATTRYGATQYTALRSSLSVIKALSSRSAASWTFKPTKKGTYLVRIYFSGGAKYTYNGSAVATGGDVGRPPHPQRQQGPEDRCEVSFVVHRDGAATDVTDTD